MCAATFIAAVSTVRPLVAEAVAGNALPITALELVVLAGGGCGWLGLPVRRTVPLIRLVGTLSNAVATGRLGDTLCIGTGKLSVLAA